MPTMRTKPHTPMPEARMAVTSLSAARRLRPRRIPTSTAMGIVTVKMSGSRARTIATTDPSAELFRTTSSSRLGR